MNKNFKAMTLPPLFSCQFPLVRKSCFENEVEICWYPAEFTQSRYPPGQEESQACTLICLLVAQHISSTELLIYNVEKCPELNIIVAEAMIEGNATHADIIKKELVPHPYLNIAEALRHGGQKLSILKEWKFHIFCENIGKSLYHNISQFLHIWYKDSKSEHLFMLLITCGRTVLFIFQEATNKVTLFDSHSHNTTDNPDKGLIIAQTTKDKLVSLCNWYNQDILNHYYNTQANVKYELAFLYPYHMPHCSHDNFISNCKNYGN